MKRYYISEKGLDWYIFGNGKDGFGEYAAYISPYLLSVKKKFESLFGKDIVNSHLMLAVVYSEGLPQCFSNNNLIFLSSKAAFYQKHVFQYSHELCHFIISRPVLPEFQWLEETLCQLMSWVVMLRLHEHRESYPYQLSMYEQNPQYVETDMSEAASMCGDKPSAFLSAHLPELEQNCCDRPVNSAIAMALLPVFTQYPELWQLALCLPNFTQDMSLDDAFRAFHTSGLVSEPAFLALFRVLFQ